MNAQSRIEKPPLKILLCSPRGFCAGVVRAIDAVERALAVYGAPVYVRHEIVHNRYVVEALKAKGAIFVEELAEVPDTPAPVIFSAHGVPKSVSANAAKRNLLAIDATCPLVTKVHREAEIHHRRGRRPARRADRRRLHRRQTEKTVSPREGSPGRDESRTVKTVVALCITAPHLSCLSFRVQRETCFFLYAASILS